MIFNDCESKTTLTSFADGLKEVTRVLEHVRVTAERNEEPQGRESSERFCASCAALSSTGSRWRTGEALLSWLTDTAAKNVWIHGLPWSPFTSMQGNAESRRVRGMLNQLIQSAFEYLTVSRKPQLAVNANARELNVLYCAAASEVKLLNEEELLDWLKAISLH